jgi:Exonuclease
MWYSGTVVHALASARDLSFPYTCSNYMFFPPFRSLLVPSRLPTSRLLPKFCQFYSIMEPHRPLDFYDGPLVWVDCEMTGLNPRKDKILEIAVRSSPSKATSISLNACSYQVIITNGNLDLVDDGIQFVIRTDKEVLDG